MDERYGFEGLCIAFLLGNIAGAIILHIISPEHCYAYFHIAAIISAIALIGTIILKRHHSVILLLALCLFTIGQTGYISDYITGPNAKVVITQPQDNITLPEKSVQALKVRIQHIGFKNPNTEGLVQALLTGDKTFLDRDIKNAFRKSGAAHILALSGMHLGVIYLILSKILLCLGMSPFAKKARSLIIICCTIYYAIMTGASDSIVRATLFIMIRETCKLSDRITTPSRTLLAAITIQLMIKPSALLSPGFQLSYLAMYGIFTVFPKMESWYDKMTELFSSEEELQHHKSHDMTSTGTIVRHKETKKREPMRKLWSLMALSISCQIFTAPVAWYHFHSFPTYFLLTNLIAMPITSALMVISVGLIFLPSGMTIIVKIADLLASALIFCLETIIT